MLFRLLIIITLSVFEDVQLYLTELNEITSYLVLFRDVELSFQFDWIFFWKSKVPINFLIQGVFIESEDEFTDLNGFINLTKDLNIELIVVIDLNCA